MLITALSQYEGTMLFVSHDRHFLAALSNRVLELTPRHPPIWRRLHRYVARTGRRRRLAELDREAAPAACAWHAPGKGELAGSELPCALRDIAAHRAIPCLMLVIRFMARIVAASQSPKIIGVDDGTLRVSAGYFAKLSFGQPECRHVSYGLQRRKRLRHTFDPPKWAPSLISYRGEVYRPRSGERD